MATFAGEVAVVVTGVGAELIFVMWVNGCLSAWENFLLTLECFMPSPEDALPDMLSVLR